jgi:hypothetical protein
VPVTVVTTTHIDTAVPGQKMCPHSAARPLLSHPWPVPDRGNSRPPHYQTKLQVWGLNTALRPARPFIYPATMANSESHCLVQRCSLAGRSLSGLPTSGRPGPSGESCRGCTYPLNDSAVGISLVVPSVAMRSETQSDKPTSQQGGDVYAGPTSVVHYRTATDGRAT